MIGSPIERRKVYAQIAERLLGQIGAGHLRPGDPLPTERQLTQSFRVGRSSVREALRILESQGVIKPVASGAFVVAEASSPLHHSLDLLLTLQGATLRELFEVRKILEAESAALAATRRTESELIAMAGAIEEMRDSLQTQERYIAADLRFHLTIAAATRNRMTQHMMQAIRAPLQRALGSIYYIPGSPQRSIDQHRQILQAIRLGDPVAARQRMREHLARVEGDIDDMLSPHPALGPDPVRMGGRRG
ncbi:MAG TPA: FadR/GntR family transcriptional regulator [bacterium]|nr:FadR/GntR family transcriptional regulator [bacterium]